MLWIPSKAEAKTFWIRAVLFSPREKVHRFVVLIGAFRETKVKRNKIDIMPFYLLVGKLLLRETLRNGLLL